MDWIIASIDVVLIALIGLGALLALSHRIGRQGGRSSDFDAAHHGPRREKERS